MNKQKTLILSLSAMLFIALAFIVYSWTEPTSMPSSYSVPLNTSTEDQGKAGKLFVTELHDFNSGNYYINLSGDSILAGDLRAGGKIYAGEQIQETDPSSTVVNKGYVNQLINADKGSQTLYLVGKNVMCPDGYESLERRWSARTCANYNLCTTEEGWYKDPPSCYYIARGGCGNGYNGCVGGDYPPSSGCCWKETCTANNWDEIMCIGMTKGDDEYLATAKHQVDECPGEVVTVTGGYKICRVEGSTCPSGWSQFYNWSTTVPTTNYCSNCSGCKETGSHTWSNSPQETCATAIWYSGSNYDSRYEQIFAAITQIGCI